VYPAQLAVVDPAESAVAIYLREEVEDDGSTKQIKRNEKM
jgi:hypothetical protein